MGENNRGDVVRPGQKDLATRLGFSFYPPSNTVHCNTLLSGSLLNTPAYTSFRWFNDNMNTVSIWWETFIDGWIDLVNTEPSVAQATF